MFKLLKNYIFNKIYNYLSLLHLSIIFKLHLKSPLDFNTILFIMDKQFLFRDYVYFFNYYL